jgi:hypothetical protein
VKGDIKNVHNPNWTHCITEIDGFFSAMLFSIETQHTIGMLQSISRPTVRNPAYPCTFDFLFTIVGYGTRSITQYCPEALIILMLQSTVGVIIQALMTGEYSIICTFQLPQQYNYAYLFSNRVCRQKNIDKLKANAL